MNNYSIIDNFGKLWSKIYNPHSGCPDICLGTLFTEMVNIAAEEIKNNKFTSTEIWAIAYISLSEKTEIMGTSELEVQLSYADTCVKPVTSYILENNEYKRKPDGIFRKELKQEEKDQAEAMEKMDSAIKDLIELGYLVLVDGRLKIGDA